MRRLSGRSWRRTARVGATVGVELALGGAIDGGAQGGAAGVLKRLGEGVGEAKSGSARSSSASGFKGEKGFSTAARGFNLAALNRQWMRTSARGTAASSCVARRVAARAKAALPRRQSTPLLSTVAVHIRWNPVLWFCKIRPKFELNTKFLQNKSCSEIYKLQNIFWWPELILSGRM